MLRLMSIYKMKYKVIYKLVAALDVGDVQNMPQLLTFATCTQFWNNVAFFIMYINRLLKKTNHPLVTHEKRLLSNAD